MAELSHLNRWERFSPDIGDNRSLKAPFYLEVASGLPRVQLEAFSEGLTAAVEEAAAAGSEREKAEVYAKAFAPYVRMGREPLCIGGKAYPTLADYLELITSMAGSYNHLELGHAVRDFNSVAGTRRLFFERLSGGSTGTPSPSNGSTDVQRAAPSGGSQTSATASSAGTSPPDKEKPLNPVSAAP